MLRIKKPLTFLVAFGVASYLLFVTGASSTQEESRASSSLATKNHRWLAQDAGKWKARCTIDGAQGKFEFEGVENITVDLQGLWVFGSFSAEFMGQPFSGRGFRGYDEGLGKFVGAWVDNTSTRITHLEGVREGDELVLVSKGVVPGTDQTYSEKHVHRRVSEDERRFEIFALREGEEHLLMSVVYTRID